MKNIPCNDQPGCLNAAAQVLGDKWTPLLVRILASGPTRFCRLQDEVGGVNPRTLSARLSTLEKEGIITKRVYPEVPARVEYSLTKKGGDLLPILHNMAEWSEKYQLVSPK
jgi:DNA-binding HxlR family transcriptional regulator